MTRKKSLSLFERAAEVMLNDQRQVDSPPTALEVQEGGSHYVELKIQPVEYIQANGLNFFEGNVLKYITRHRAKGGADDLRKAKHYIELQLKLEYGE